MSGSNSSSPISSDTYDYQRAGGLHIKNWSDYFRKENFMYIFRNFLVFCAGADRQILEMCPHKEWVKEQGIGGIVLGTAVLAFFSGGYAFYTIFSDKTNDATQYGVVFLSVIFALIWALMIFNIDRFIVSSSGHGDGTNAVTWGEVGHAIPRLLMAVLIAISLSKPLEIRIMESEIESALNKEQSALVYEYKEAGLRDIREEQAKYERSKALLESETTNLTQSIATYRSVSTDLDTKMSNESTGIRAGTGPIYKALKNQQEANDLKLKEAESKLVNKNEELEKLDASYLPKVERIIKDAENKAAQEDGLIKRIEVAHELHPTATWLLFGLLLVLEISPIFMKMMLELGPYDYFVENQKRIALASKGVILAHELYAEGTTTAGGGDKKNKINLIEDAQYLAAETIATHERGKLQVEAQLTEVAHEAFVDLASKDIRSNPDKYVRDTSRAES